MGNYIVTGAAGFVGARVCELLIVAGHSVTGIDNLNDSADPRLKKWRLDRLMGLSAFKFLRIDIADSRAIGSIGCTPCDAVINLAGRAGVRHSVANPWLYIDANIAGTVNMLEFCRQNGVAKFVLASTSSVYGSGNELPYREGAVTDHPSSPYAATKKSAEVLCYVYHHLYGLDISVLRYFTVYGPAGRPDMSVFRFIQWIHEDIPVVIFGDGTQSRDFTYVDDIARGTIAALARVGFSIFNLGSDHPARVIDVLNVIERLAGKTANIVFHESHPADVRATWADISKAESILGWRPVTSHEQGLGQAVKWYQANREWAKGLCTGDG